jgi:uncharacterized protein
MTALPVTVLVVAKAPVAGLAKTRLAAAVGSEAAADIAAAALLDTLDAVAAAPVTARVVALTGNLGKARAADEIRERLEAFTVIPQRGDDFADRLANAFIDAADGGPMPVLMIAMDTPQVTAELLTRCAQRLLRGPAVLGMADDGGWWVLGVGSAQWADVLRDVPMSRGDTGALTFAALANLGIDVALVEQLRDVDTVDDVAAVRDAGTADSRFARVTRTLGV